MICLAPWPSLHISPVSKLDRRHTWRIRKRDNLLRGWGMGWERSQIIQRRESLVLFINIQYSLYWHLCPVSSSRLPCVIKLMAVFCVPSTRTSATASWSFATSSQLSGSRPGQAVPSVREGPMDRQSQHKGSMGHSPPASQGGPASVSGHLSSLRPHCSRLLCAQDSPQCVGFGLFMIWFASITVNLGPTFLRQLGVTASLSTFYCYFFHFCHFNWSCATKNCMVSPL